MNTKRLFPALLVMVILFGALAILAPNVSACNTSNIYLSDNGGASYSKVYGPDGNNGDTTLNVTYGTTTDVEAGGTVYLKFKLTLQPGCGSTYECMFKTHWKPAGWTVRILDNTSGVGKPIGTDIDGLVMGSVDTSKDGFSGTVTYFCDLIVTTAKNAPLGKVGNYVEIEVYTEDTACNDEDHIYVKVPFRVVEAHDPPVISFTAPEPNTMISESVLIGYVASDKETPDGDIKVDLLMKKVDATVWQTAARNIGSGGIGSFNWLCSSIDDGEYLLQVKAFDAGVPQKDGKDTIPVTINNPNKPEIHITNPDPTQTEVYRVEMPIRWTATDEEEDDSTLLIDLFYTTEGTMFWFPIAENEPNDGVYIWNITEMEDRPDYRIKAVAKDASGMSGEYITPYKHQINNLDGPIVDKVHPAGGQTFSGTFVIYWQAHDPDYDPLLVDIDLSRDAGETWERLATDLSNSGTCSYSIDSLEYPDGCDYMVKITVDDGEMTNYRCSDSCFAIFNNDIPKLVVRSPKEGDDLSGQVMIEWDASDEEDPSINLTADVYYKIGLSTYETLLTGQPNEGFYLWDTTSNIDFVDGIYGIKIVITDTHGASVQKEIGGLEVYNPDPPQLTVETPINEETIKGKYSIRWACLDPDGDEVTLSMFYSSDQGANWYNIALNVVNDHTYLWDTNTMDDGTYYIKVTATDGEHLTEEVVRNVTISNYVNYPPAMKINAPVVFGMYLSGNFTIKWTATD
ncbi:MAG: hypothetical protein ACMUHU_04760 [Thermoplasmatota archaeon]